MSEEDEDDLGEFDFEEEWSWYEELDGLAKLMPSTEMPTTSRKSKQKVGTCRAKLIRRSIMRESFWAEMEAPTQDTHNLAFELFDRYGRLNPELYEHDVNKGTGVWGTELDRGDLLIIETVQVDKGYRRRGIGTKLVNAILEKTRKKVSEQEGFFVLTRPGFLWREVSLLRGDPAALKEAEQAGERDALAFWHAMGFRRVGTTFWLAWTDSPDHPSRQLEADQDWTHQDDPTADVSLSGEMEQAFQKLADPGVEAAECIDELTKTLPASFANGQWQTADQDGNTLLHIAAIACKTDVVIFLISKVPRLTAMRNEKGHTPLDALRDSLERVRTQRSFGSVIWAVSDAFKGFSTSDITCLAVLEHEHMMLQYKYGCTCGQCIGGFLSPRMKRALHFVAEVESDEMQIYIDVTGSDWGVYYQGLLAHLSGSVWKKLLKEKSMRKGLADMFSHFAKCLEQGRVPSEDNVLDFCRLRGGEPSLTTNEYIERGGSVAVVGNAIFERAVEQDEWAGDGSYREAMGKEIDALVACRNDHEFGFVAGMCGYKRITPGSSGLH